MSVRCTVTLPSPSQIHLPLRSGTPGVSFIEELSLLAPQDLPKLAQESQFGSV
jgi:hypothetical protein